MDDLISRQAALRTDCFGDGHDGLRAFHMYEDYLKMRKYLESLPTAQPEQQWIPCSERLPEKYGWYMCTLKDYRVNTYYWNNKGEWIDNGKKHFFELYNISSRYTGEDITAEQEGSVYWTDWVIAWQPLPEAYRGEQK